MVIKTYYRVWWEYGGYQHFDTEQEARTAEHEKKGKPARIDRIEIIYLDNEAGD